MESFSPGLRASRYPGFKPPNSPNPIGVESKGAPPIKADRAQ